MSQDVSTGGGSIVVLKEEDAEYCKDLTLEKTSLIVLKSKVSTLVRK